MKVCKGCKHKKSEHVQGVCFHDDRKEGLCTCEDFVE